MSAEQSTVTYRDAPGFPGYRVGDDGSVWSSSYRTGRVDGKGTAVRIGGEWRLKKQCPHRKGYRTVTLAVEGREHRAYVHRLVLEAFVGPCPEGCECAHANGGRADNRLENLSWKTPVDNNADKVAHGTLLRGDRCPWAKLDAAAVAAILHRRAAGESCGQIAKTLNVRKQAVSDVCTGRRWGHLTGIAYER